MVHENSTMTLFHDDLSNRQDMCEEASIFMEPTSHQHDNNNNNNVQFTLDTKKVLSRVKQRHSYR